MRGKQPRERGSAFARWLTDERRGRNLTMQALAERSGVSKSRIGQLEWGAAPSRFIVGELAAGLAPEGAGDETRTAILSAGLVAAGFGPTNDLDRIPDPLRAVLVAHMDTLARLDADALRLLAETLERVIRLAGRE